MRAERRQNLPGVKGGSDRKHRLERDEEAEETRHHGAQLRLPKSIQQCQLRILGRTPLSFWVPAWRSDAHH